MLALGNRRQTVHLPCLPYHYHWRARPYETLVCSILLTLWTRNQFKTKIKSAHVLQNSTSTSECRGKKLTQPLLLALTLLTVSSNIRMYRQHILVVRHAFTMQSKASLVQNITELPILSLLKETSNILCLQNANENRLLSRIRLGSKGGSK